MKSTAFAAVILVAFSASAWAQDASCAAQASDKKLAGAALTSFSKRCQRDASAACDKQATERKLRGAAKTSFTKKCVQDAVGS